MTDRSEDGRFASGNEFWKQRSTHGSNPIFDGPDPLWDACCEYFDWNERNPLYKDQLVTFQGSAIHEPLSQLRAMTIAGLCMFLDINRQTWNEWRNTRADLSKVIEKAEAVIFRQKFEGAAADLLNVNIISRELGLAEKIDNTSSDGTMSPKSIVGDAVLDAIRAKHGVKDS